MLELTAGDIEDLSLIARGTFPKLIDNDGDPITLTYAQRRRVQRWGRLLTSASVGYIDSDPILANQTRRLAAVFAERDAEFLCEMVRHNTGGRFPA